MKIIFFACFTIAWTTRMSIAIEGTDYDEIQTKLNPKTRIEIITEKGKRWRPSLDYYCKYRIYDDYSTTPCFCLSMSLKFKYSYNTNKELKRIETTVPEAYLVHGSCFPNNIYVTISWPKYPNPSELLYYDPPKENFIFMVLKKNHTNVWMDELSITMQHEIGHSRRSKKTEIISDTLLDLNFTTPVYDGIYVCDRPIELKGLLDVMEITIENLRFFVYNGIRIRKESQCRKTTDK